jgi:CTP:molybdopterin cytidylyltransferase MocA
VSSPVVVGLLLAAGEGQRLGRPKALVEDADTGTWMARSVAALRDGGVDEVYVVVGACAEEVTAAVPRGCDVVSAADWHEGMGASLRRGLAAVSAGAVDGEAAADAVIVMLVDTPGVGGAVVRRLAGRASREALARASYAGRPGHPVLLGRDHWSGVLDVARGDRGARDYLRTHQVTLVDCTDVGAGTDVDTAESLAAWRAAPRYM